MCEPEQKRRKCSPPVEDEGVLEPSPPPVQTIIASDNEVPDWSEFSQALDTMQKAIISKCLCGQSLETLQLRIVRPAVVLTTLLELGEKLQKEALMICSTAELLYSEILRQSSVSLMCPNLVEIRTLLPLGHSADLTNVLFRLVLNADKFVSYAAAQALFARLKVSSEPSALLLIDRVVIDCVKPCLSETSVPVHTLGHALEVLRLCVNSQDEDTHPLEEREELSASCTPLSVTQEDEDELDLKESCVRILGKQWNSVVSHFHFLISSCRGRTSISASAIVSFLSLWQSIISVKANLSVIDTKPFYMRLESLVPLLKPEMPELIWTSILALLNEVLCYGSTLALQDFLPEEPCNLAHFVIRHVKNERLLERLPVAELEDCFGGTIDLTGDAGPSGGDDDVNVLLKKLILLVLKAVAVTVKETRCESSSEGSSIFSDGGSAGDEADMLVITRSMKQVFKTVDLRVKSILHYHPETPVAEWVARMFADQDDDLIESLLCCLDIYTGLSDALKSQPEFQRTLNPCFGLLQFLSIVHNDSTVLLDLLVSNETCFLLYLLRVLKYVRKNWPAFLSSCARLDETMGTFIRLRMAINRLVSKNLFPYNIDPVVKLLQKCEDMFEGTPAE